MKDNIVSYEIAFAAYICDFDHCHGIAKDYKGQVNIVFKLRDLI